MKVTVRQATQADADALAELCAEVQAIHVQLHPHLFLEPALYELADFFRDRLDDPDFTAYLAFDGDQPVGYVLLNVVRRPANLLLRKREYLEIDQICVRENHRRQGIGEQLVSRAAEVARELGVEEVQLNVWADNAPAVAAFEALGFKKQRHVMSHFEAR